MRFASLSLERYGHFEDRAFSFRAGVPDLHVIYGANEAGKTTLMNAVSDLLFGFPARSPYNFIYDYALLRIGAVLEDAGITLSCRRKKGTNATLLDTNDRPLDEGKLLAMLHGQTRETFRLSFSLNQEGLRSGGQAMLEASNDLGRALFAAGAGLTGIADELSGLEAEAGEIWGPRASKNRLFTQAQRDLEASKDIIRAESLKPKAWSDAKSDRESKHEAQIVAQRQRDELLADVSRIERVRRIAPFVRLRADHLAELQAHANTIDILPQREIAAVVAMEEIEAAKRARDAAARLVGEAREEIKSLNLDPLILDYEGRIDELFTVAGAVAKARQDRLGLDAELAMAARQVQRLRDETRMAGTPPTRIVSSSLREYALQHAKDMSGLRQIEESEENLASSPSATTEASDAPGCDLSAICAAVDAARALGADIDARCLEARRKAESAGQARDQALARLMPWIGDLPALTILPRVMPAEIDEARAELAACNADIKREADMALRAREEAETLAVEIAQLAAGTAVSAEEIVAVRAARDKYWQPVRAHVLSGLALPVPDQSVADFEASITQADETDDRRFAASDKSSRLAEAMQHRERQLLKAQQAEDRSAQAEARAKMRRHVWAARLIDAGYPALEPACLPGWLADRDDALAASRAADALADEARTMAEQRDAVRAELVGILGAEAGVKKGDELAPVLALAEKVRREGEDCAQQKRLNEAAAQQRQREAETLMRRRAQLETAIQARAVQWGALLAEAGVSLDISRATTILDGLDELRDAIAKQTDLQARIEGIGRDEASYADAVAAIADALGIEASQDTSARLTLLRTRLQAARAVANKVATLEETIRRRAEEGAVESAKIDAALEALQPLMAETHAADILELGGAIERSRSARALRQAVEASETSVKTAGDGKSLAVLLEEVKDIDIDDLAAQAQSLTTALMQRNEEVDRATAAYGEAKRAFDSLETDGDKAANAASDAEQARAELADLSERFILKRAQAVTLRWVIEQYRERHQDPMLSRAGQIFSTLTTGRYGALRIDNEKSEPRLLGLRDDGRTLVEVGAMSEGTADQLFLALRLAAVEQSVAAGVRLPFLADDLFVNFDDERAEAGFRVLADLAKVTQVLFFTHHPHLVAIGRTVVGADAYAEYSVS